MSPIGPLSFTPVCLRCYLQEIKASQAGRQTPSQGPFWKQSEQYTVACEPNSAFPSLFLHGSRAKNVVSIFKEREDKQYRMR